MSLRNQESFFEPSELFFSRTRRNGVLLSGNAVFARVSKYAIKDMISKAHSLVRHPDMPRAVFKYMWDEILAGRGISAYVKNKASDGSFYWVLASVFPYGDEFISIRIKPTSGLVQKVVEPLYKKIRDSEASSSLSDQVDALLANIKTAGFADYTQFMRAALSKELGPILPDLLGKTGGADDFSDTLAQMQKSMSGLLSDFDRTSKIVEHLESSFGDLAKSAQAEELLPFNLTLATQKSQATQKTMEVLSGLFAQQQKEVLSFLTEFRSIIADAESNGLAPLRYDVAGCFINITMVAQFLAEIHSRDVEEKYKMDSEQSLRECIDLMKLSGQQFERTLINVNEIRSRFIKIMTKREEMETLVKTVQSIAQLGQVEISQDLGIRDSALPHLDKMREMAKYLNERIVLIGIELRKAASSLDDASKSLIKSNRKCAQVQIQLDRSLRQQKAA